MMTKTYFDQLSSMGKGLLLTAFLVLYIFAEMIYFVTDQKKTFTQSVDQCPPTQSEYNTYFCQGVDLSRFDASSTELAQGFPNGYVYAIGPISPINMNFQLDLDFEMSGESEVTLTLEGTL